MGAEALSADAAGEPPKRGAGDVSLHGNVTWFRYFGIARSLCYHVETRLFLVEMFIVEVKF